MDPPRRLENADDASLPLTRRMPPPDVDSHVAVIVSRLLPQNDDSDPLTIT
ncbi:hypothetical protein F7O44_25835 [Phytoactinopolyspora sp. XMNu-373]|uniref:Uncharacterized protein n=1 Tax=Phytoactinopolyspora mesophila TaxID=2650750 RepID=A0A7K3MB34_9ACTN|nr:hypothetical protein [Phytoactinopolyspora mesophila]